MRIFLFKSIITVLFLIFLTHNTNAQLPNPAMVGYWENWNGNRFVKLKDIDQRYNVIQIAFLESQPNRDYEVFFKPPYPYTEESFKDEMQSLQAKGKKVLISIGGQNDIILLDSMEEKDAFVESMNSLIDKWGFDGIDIDLEGNSLDFQDINIDNPGDIKQRMIIEAIHEIMRNYRSTHNKKLLLTMAPETFYVNGGLSGSSLGYKRGAYLPIIEDLRDSIDMLNVQLYNSGSMYGLDKKIYNQGSADWVVAMTEAIIRGFTSSGIGTYSGLPAHKVGVALPGCHSYDAVPHDDVIKALNYLMGKGPQPGNYQLIQDGGYPEIRGLMTWSINSDRKCTPSYGFVETWSKIFTDSSFIEMSNIDEILEGEEDGKIIEISLFNDTFITPLNIADWEIKNLPEGVSLGSISRINDTTAHLTLSGSSSDSYMRDITNVRVICGHNQVKKQKFEDLVDRSGLTLTKKPQLIPGEVEAEGYFDIQNAYAASNWEEENSYYIRVNKSGWADIKVDVANDNNYLMTLKVATMPGQDNYLTIRADGKVILNKLIKSSTFFKTWDEFTFDVNLTKGIQTLRLNVTKGWLDIEKVNFELSNSISEIEKSTLTVFPNPCIDNFNFDSPDKGVIYIYGSKGELLHSQNIIKGYNKIDVKKLNNGILIIKAFTDQGLIKYDKILKVN